MADEVLLTERRGAVAVVTLNRPARRNALNGELVRALVEAVARLDADPDVRVLVLTGADPAFCAGVDLKEVGGAGGGAPVHRDPWPGTFPPHDKPIIGAVNGPAATGGLEIALNCDFLVASERAAFVDTHVAVNVMPGWGLTVLLPQRVGLARAKEMSLTSNFVDAATALAWGLVNHVVPHEELMDRTLALAEAVAAQEPAPMVRIRRTYDEVAATTAGAGWELELEVSRAWEPAYDLGSMDQRREELVARARRSRPGR
ncbi:MAG TPA: enoyl-CoA hydratase [Acidimicrobiales bacterium]|nr:enoyl-CoA hydratase [Acidimicrobiales bacterium]